MLGLWEGPPPLHGVYRSPDLVLLLSPFRKVRFRYIRVVGPPFSLEPCWSWTLLLFMCLFNPSLVTILKLLCGVPPVLSSVVVHSSSYHSLYLRIYSLLLWTLRHPPPTPAPCGSSTSHGTHSYTLLNRS